MGRLGAGAKASGRAGVAMLLIALGQQLAGAEPIGAGADADDPFSMDGELGVVVGQLRAAQGKPGSPLEAEAIQPPLNLLRNSSPPGTNPPSRDL